MNFSKRNDLNCLDGKYLLVNRTEFVVSTISKEKTYCLKFWYSADGSSRKTLKIENVEKQIDNNQRGEFEMKSVF